MRLVYFRMILCLYFRQVDPTPNNLAAKSLAEDIQQRNVRKLKVNAQVTFAIYICEVIITFSLILLWMFFEQAVFSKIASILFYYVLLPYVYIMNTANNKNRITDEGWRNTFKNALGISTNIDTELHQQAQEENSNMQTSRTIPNTSKNDVSITERNKTGIGGNKQKLVINTISYNTKEKRTSEFHNQNTTIISEIEACSSSCLLYTSDSADE